MTKTTKKGSNAVTKATKNEVALPFDYGTDAGAGINDIGREDMAIPFINCLQGLSEEVKPVKQGGLAGAEVGMLLNSVTKELYDGDVGITVIASVRTKEFIEWVPRAKGGGFVAAHGINSEVVAEAKQRARENGADFGKFTTVAGNDLIETWQLAITSLDENDEPVGPAVVPFTSTKLKKLKAFNYRLRSIKGNPPLYGIKIQIRTVAEKNTKGDFYNLDLKFAVNDNAMDSMVAPDSAAFLAAKALVEAIDSGVARADYESNTNSGEASDGTPDF